MPALYAFGRRWQVGTDDFVFPGLLDTTIKSGWLLAAIAVYIFSEGFETENGNLLRIYLIGMITTLLTVVLTDILATQASMRGHIMDTESRKMVVPLIYLRLFWEAIDIGWNILGTVWVFGGTFEVLEERNPTTFYFVRRYVICNWASVVILGLFLAFLFDPLGKHPILIAPDITNFEDYENKISLSWEKRFRKYCCFFGIFDKSETKNRGFREVGRVCAYVMQDTVFVGTDIVAGLFAHYKKTKYENGGSIALRNPVNVNPIRDLSNPVTKKPDVVTVQPLTTEENVKQNAPSSFDLIHEIDYFFQYVNGSSGWKGYIVSNRSKQGIEKLWDNIICCGCLQPQTSINVEGDNCCYCNMAVLKETVLNFKDEDLICVSFKNDYYKVPFYIVLDHTKKSYVIAIRGTYSGKDIITDLTAWPVPETFPGINGECMVHNGMLIAAKKLMNKIRSLGVLEKMKNSYPDYNLVLVGQSLGGGIATLCGMMLYPTYPDLKIYVYNPPGGLFSLNAAIWSEKFTISVTCGTDGLARISLPALKNLKKNVIDTIYSCKTPKYKLLLGVLGGMIGLKTSVDFFPEHKAEGQINSAFNQSLSSLSSIEDPEAGKEVAKSFDSTRQPTMYLPGRILHITKKFESDVPKEGDPSFEYEMNWVDREQFLEIILSPRIYADHWHFQMLSAFKEYKLNYAYL